MSQKSRRSFIVQTGQLVVGTLLGAHLTPAGAPEHMGGHAHEEGEGGSAQEFITPADTTRHCATCQYWGGIRRVSRDRKQVSSQSLGWCNNPKSHHYQQTTTPDTGPMKSWRRWDALA